MRKLNDDENVANGSNQNETLSINTEASTSTDSTEVPLADDKVSFKSFNSTTKSTDNIEKSRQTKKKPKQKKRVNRGILSTLLSRKKLYKLLEHKLEM